MKSLPTSHASTQTPIILLPPRDVTVPSVFRSVKPNVGLYSTLLGAIQRFRGALYCQDGAISPHELTADGRHDAPADEKSWHVAALNAEGEIIGCLRFHDETPAADFQDLGLSHSSIARCGAISTKLRPAVEREMAYAKSEGMRFGEVGGWAIAPERRRSAEALRIVLATYGLLELLGGCIGMATATLRHGSAGILRRIGLSSVIADGFELPPYYDPEYDCEMELLRFDSRHANPKFTDWIHEFTLLLRTTTVVSGSANMENFWPYAGEPAAHLPIGTVPAAQPAYVS